MNTNTRNADLGSILNILREQEARKLDVVAHASQIRSVDGILRLTGSDPILTDDGVTSADGYYAPTMVADEHIAGKLNIPLAYLRRLRDDRTDLYDANVNGWLYGRKDKGTFNHATGELDAIRPGTPGDDRSFMLRLFRGDDGGFGVARAVLSNSYRRMDNLDVLMSVLEGVRETGLATTVSGGDLTDRRMVVRITAPEISALAPTLLRGYRSPFTGESGTDNPVVFAGLEISNSEVGGGAFSITPRLVVQVCSNGMKITKDAMRSVHLGSTLEDGTINWSEETERRNLEPVRSKAVDAVTTFLDVDYMTKVIEKAEEKSETVVKTTDKVKDITKALKFSQTHIDGILGYFVQGGQMTLGGVSQAITAYAQTVDGDSAYELETRAMDLLLA